MLKGVRINQISDRTRTLMHNHLSQFQDQYYESFRYPNMKITQKIFGPTILAINY